MQSVNNTTTSFSRQLSQQVQPRAMRTGTTATGNQGVTASVPQAPVRTVAAPTTATTTQNLLTSLLSGGLGGLGGGAGASNQLMLLIMQLLQQMQAPVAAPGNTGLGNTGPGNTGPGNTGPVTTTPAPAPAPTLPVPLPTPIVAPALAAAPAGAHALGKEDQPLALKWADFRISVADSDGIMIKALPADGMLQIKDGTAWKNVSANQVISKADVDAGHLRFVPDANESGVDGYQPGVGNMKSDYAQLDFAVTRSQVEVSQTGRMSIDIAPVADPKLTITASMHSNTTPPPGHTQWEWLTPDGVVTNAQDKTASYGTWQLVKFGAKNTSPDKDGSEKAMISFKVNNYDHPKWSPYQVVTLPDGTVIKPDDKGNYLVPADTAQVHVFRAWGKTPVGNVASHQTVTATAVTREVDAGGKVLDELKGNTVNTASNTPIMLDLNGDGLQTRSSQEGVTFDYAGTGHAMQGGWSSAEDGLLALDLDGNGKIDSGAELFGDGTRLADGSTAIDGYQALSQYDLNGDQKIDRNDAIYKDLLLWVDANGDGKTQDGELKQLASMGIASLDLDARKTAVEQNGNTIGLMSSYTTTQGQQLEMGDVWFGTQVEVDADK